MTLTVVFIVPSVRLQLIRSSVPRAIHKNKRQVWLQKWLHLGIGYLQTSKWQVMAESKL
jgi:pSer/pThr/pTyr-binding forkhead associated (FHA) protein